MDLLFIRELKVETIIGVFDWEKNNRQTLIIDVDMAVDIRKAVETDNLQDTVDYKAVADRLTDYMENNHFNLVESLAEGLATVLQTEFGIRWLRLRIAKPGPLDNARDVGVLIERGEKF